MRKVITDIFVHFPGGGVRAFHLGEKRDDNWNSRLKMIEADDRGVILTYMKDEDGTTEREIRFVGMAYEVRFLVPL